MSDFAYTFFDTAVGRCSLLWGPRGIVRLQLPERSDEATRERLLRQYPDAPERAPPPAIQSVIDDIGALLAGAEPDLASVPLDLDGVAAFNQEVYAIARKIPAGKTLTYGAIAKQMKTVEPGDAGAARAVGQALGRNPIAIIIPCHRVLAAAGNGGFSAQGGVATKRKLLALEGYVLPEQMGLF